MPLSNITNSTYFQSYITNSHPELIQTVGAITIVDNTNNTIPNLPDAYSLFIDDTFIATGYGATTYEDYSHISYVISSYNHVFSYFDDEINNIYDKYLNINYDDNIILSKELNEYNFVTSYTVLNIDHTINNRNIIDGYVNDYQFNKATIGCKYLDDVMFEYDLTNSDSNTCFINMSYTYITGGSNTSINNDIELRIIPKYNTTTITLGDGESKIYPMIEFSTNSGIASFGFNSTENRIMEDLAFQFVKNNKVIYSYTYKNLLKWPTVCYTFPEVSSSMIGCLNTLNTFNFRNTNISDDIKSTIATNTEQIIQTLSSQNIEENELTVTFINNSPSYDYIVIFKEFILNNNIEFFFNGIRSNNWRCINVDDNMYVWQSPQKYIGSHDWTIRFK